MTLGAIQPTTGLIVLTTSTLFLGLGIDLGFTSQRLAELQQMRHEREELEEQAWESTRRVHWARQLADVLDVQELTDLREGPRKDPLSYANELLEDTKLVRLELTVTETGVLQGVQHTQFILRVSGSYADILQFISDVERGKPLAAIDAISIAGIVGDHKKLEARLTISMYQPAGSGS